MNPSDRERLLAIERYLRPRRTQHRRPTNTFTQRFWITEAEFVRIEREGPDNNWPPR
jgi:hypothetical protein